MDSDFIKEQLGNLEKSMRYLVQDSEWILLEPIDDQLLEEYRHLENIQLAEEDRTPESIDKRHPAAIADAGPRPRTASAILPINPTATKQPPVKASIPPALQLKPLEADNLDSLKLRLKDCDRCQLCQNRSTIVFGQGNQQADLVFVGEGPGEEEDRTGLAFVGKAGKLLTQIIHSIGLNRESVYIGNIVKCRPPGNRNPNADEITACYPFLKKQIELLDPKLIVTLGNVATKAIIPNALGIMKMRGRIIDHNGIPLIPTFHPSYLLRNPKALTDVWTDMRKIRQVIHQQNSNNPS